MPFTYNYPHFALTVDAILLADNHDGLNVLLIQRRDPPFQNQWAFPGGFVDIDEMIDLAVYRELEEETTISNIKLIRFDVFDAIDRDPRERVVTIAYYGFTKIENVIINARDDARDVKWFPVNSLPHLAFDHKYILNKLLDKIKA